MAAYNLIYDFKHTLVGATRDFMKDDQTIKLRLSSQAIGSGGIAKTFVVQLQVLVPGPGKGYVTIRNAAFPRTGLDEVEWKGLPRGKYRLRFEKSTDGVQIIGTGVISN